jgi:Tol biopolymer transport system component
MTLNDGFDRTVSDWLNEKAGRGAPGYLDETLTRTARTRQRPAWSSLERWLPVQTTLRFVPVPRLAWLLIVLGLIVALGAAVVVIGSRPNLPPPFGLAANGLVVYSAADGDIYAFDPVTGRTTAIVTGVTNDRDPWFARDGSRFVFTRDTNDVGQFDVMVANADGSGVRRLTGPFRDLDWIDWSADGAKLAIVSTQENGRALQILDSETGAATALDLGPSGSWIAWRPDGRELVFQSPDGLHAVRPDGSGRRTIATSSGSDVISPTLSPDGRRVAYITWDASKPVQGVLHTIDVESGDVSTPVFDGTTVADEAPVWSSDSAHLAFERYRGTEYVIAVAPTAGGHVVELGQPHPEMTGGANRQFSPDGSKILATYLSDGTTWIFDIASGSETKATGTLAGGTWQRLAP